MNASQSKFNQSQSQMRKTNQTNPGEFGSSNLGKLTQTGANFGATNSANAATLKGKLQLDLKEKKEVTLYYCENYYNYFYGVMPISTFIE